ncbi:MAG: CPBP family intramembrane glutamic endopeptidase [Terracidiphilus sp.]|jgi:membrane protease YdiL (CAAX protease family)
MNHSNDGIGEHADIPRGGVPKATGWIFPALTYCTLTFAASWWLWTDAGTLDDFEWKLNFLQLHLSLPNMAVLTVAGSLAPGIVALFIGYMSGWREYPNLVSQLRPRMYAGRLFLFSILAPILVVLLTFMAQEGMNLNAVFSLQTVDFVRLFFVNILLAPLWEEYGWRGCLLPLLSKRFGLGRSSLIIGLLWAAWHFPLYHFVFRATLTSYLISSAAIVGMSVVLSVLYSASSNSILLPVLFHAAWNAASIWVIDAEPRCDLGPALLEAVAVWFLAGLSWFWWHRLRK